MSSEIPINKGSVEELSESLKRFGFFDYGAFILMLVVCSCIGIYFGYEDHEKHKKHPRNRERRGSEAMDYLTGGRSLSIFPVAMSLVASFISGIFLLGTSTEVYLYGFQFALINVAALFTGVFMYYFVIPIFHEMNITSTYEYLECRFDKRIRTLCSFLFSLAQILWMPIAIYVPALAFNQVTGINIHVITPIVCMICIFYTCLGGIKAVVWTDVVQIIIMYGVLFLIVFKGTYDVGGLSVVIQRNLDSGRLEYPEFDPTIRHTFWAFIFGGTLYWININAFNQTMVQRYFSVKDVRSARKALIIFILGFCLMSLLCCYNGLLLFATYHDCDPLQTKLAKAKDQMMPLMVMEILKDLPGLSGLFISGVFSAALSSLSTSLNSLAAVLLEDFFKSFSKRPLTEVQTAVILRSSVCIIGVFSVGMVYVVEHMGSVLQLSMSFSSCSLGPIFGVYMIGLFVPWIGSKATLIGAITSLISISYVTISAQSEQLLKIRSFETKPLTVDGCDYDFTPSVSNSTTFIVTDGGTAFHHMSYLYYTAFGGIVQIVVAVIYSLIFGFEDLSNVNPNLLARFVRRFVINKQTEIKLDVYDQDKACVVHTFDESKQLNDMD